MQQKPSALVIGGGPAGLMAADQLAQAGCSVTLAEAKPSLGRKLLMAGKSGLNLTKDEPFDTFMAAYDDRADWLRPMMAEFGPDQVMDWARELGQPMFTGTSGRVFPEVMKASPLLRAWIGRLSAIGVEFKTRWRWTGWDDGVTFDTHNGAQTVIPDVTVLGCGGASWARLGSDGAWADHIDIAPFEPANAALSVPWSGHMAQHFGSPLKAMRFTAGRFTSRSEAILSARGLEGSGIYAVSRGVREGATLTVDLIPDRSAQDITAKLSRPRGKTSLSNHLRKSLGLDPVRIALLNEYVRPLPQNPAQLAALLKSLPIPNASLRPIDEAISTAGGVPQSALNKGLMLRTRPGVFCAGEMLDWEAPTGGYLLTACLATGRWAGQHAADWVTRAA